MCVRTSLTSSNGRLQISSLEENSQHNAYAAKKEINGFPLFGSKGHTIKFIESEKKNTSTSNYILHCGDSSYSDTLRTELSNSASPGNIEFGSLGLWHAFLLPPLDRQTVRSRELLYKGILLVMRN